MAAATSFKSENDLRIQPDPDHPSPASQAVQEDFEDAGELEIPRVPKTAWLTRVPKILYDKWATIEEDEEVQIGVVRRHKVTGAVGYKYCDSV